MNEHIIYWTNLERSGADMASMIKNVKKSKESNKEVEDFKSEFYNICACLKKYEQLFNMTENDDLLEALIYEHKALESRYTYLMKKARDMEIEINFYERM